MSLDYVVAPISAAKPTKLVVFLHGYGSNAQDLLTLAPILQECLPATKFMAVNAPEVCELNMPDSYQWFSLSDTTNIPASVTNGYQLLTEFLQEQLQETNLTSKDLILFGFSQGAAMAVYTGLQFTEDIGAIVCCSGFSLFTDPNLICNKHTPVCILYGEADSVVAKEYFTELQAVLYMQHIPCTIHAYPNMDHLISPIELQDIQTFLRTTVIGVDY